MIDGYDWAAARHSNRPQERFMVECPHCKRVDQAHRLLGEWDEETSTYEFKCCGHRANLHPEAGARSWLEGKA